MGIASADALGASGRTARLPVLHDERMPHAQGPTVRALVRDAGPAVLVGCGSALTLWLVDVAAAWLQSLVWSALPAQLGVNGYVWWYVLAVLTTTGLLVGLVVQFVPGHGGDDSAMTELDVAAPSLRLIPSIVLVLILALAGGVSLGPENPILAVNAALAVALVARIGAKIPPAQAALLASAGTISALLGTPVAAALLFAGVVAGIKGGGSLWDKLFLPMVAAAAAAITMILLGGHAIGGGLGPIGPIEPLFLVYGVIIAAVAALLGDLMGLLLPIVHRAFHALRHPVVFTTLGGFILGLLGILGGPLTLFKGLEQTAELLAQPDEHTVPQLALYTGVKVLALLVAAACGFRGGRIFPVIFIGVALGMLVSALVPAIPLALAVACAAAGLLLAATRDGWVAMFVGVALVGDIAILPLLCVVILPAWLLVTRAPELVVRRPAETDIVR